MAHSASLSTKVKSHLQERHLWMAASDSKKESVREEMSVLLERFASCRVDPPLQPKPKYPLDDESMCSGLYGYIDVEHMKRSVAVPSSTLIAREYSCLEWLLINSTEYTHDLKSTRCASEADVDTQILRNTLAKGGYFVVERLDTHKPLFLDVKFHDLDPKLKHLYPLHAPVVVQGGEYRFSGPVVDLIESDTPLDILGRNAQPVKLETAEHLDEQKRVLSVLQEELRPLFDVSSLSEPRLHERAFPTIPSPDLPRNVEIWNAGIDWDHAELTFRKFVRSAAEMSTLYNLLDCKLYGSPRRPSFVNDVADDIRALSLHPASTKPIDALQYPSWGLVAHAGSLTLAHHDSGGLSTFITECTGVKYWFYAQWIGDSPSLEEQAFRYQAASDFNVMALEYGKQPPWVKYNHRFQEFMFEADEYRSESSLQWRQSNPKVSRIHVIRIEPGMCVLQPSNAVHAVYNATDCVALGGHFLSLESLPLAEMGRRLDHVLDTPLTNDCHASINLIMQGFCLLLNNPGNSTLSTAQLLSLTRMVFYPRSYRNQLIKEDDLDEIIDRAVHSKVKAILRTKLLGAHLPLPDESMSPGSSPEV